MPRTKNPKIGGVPKKRAVAKGRKTKGSTSGTSDRRAEKRPRESSPPPRTKSASHIKWEKKVDKKAFVIERRVDVGKLGTGECFGAMINSKLEYMDTAFAGYLPNFVRQFLKSMELVKTLGEQITAMVNGTKVRVDEYIIAKALGYTPVARERITYPRSQDVPLVIPYDQLVLRGEAVVEGTTTVGNLNGEAGMLNKIMHYNIFPRGDEKMLGRKEMELLWVIWSPNEGMNIAQFIYSQMRRYPEESTVKAVIPYPCLITKICLNQKVEKGLICFYQVIEGQSLSKQWQRPDHKRGTLHQEINLLLLFLNK